MPRATEMILQDKGFWKHAFAWKSTVAPRVLANVVVFGVFATAIHGLANYLEQNFQIQIGLEITPFEFVGAVLGLLLVLRTNAGYDRWWEARKLWGGIVNQSRNLALGSLTYGPHHPEWRNQFIHWAMAFPHVARHSLRGEELSPEVVALVGAGEARRMTNSGHMPSYVAYKLASLLREANEKHGMNPYAFMQVDRERAQLIDHIGACERILKSPLPFVYSVKIRRFITLFLLMMPFVLLHRLENQWLVPFITMMVAYPLIALDQIGVELQNPFSRKNLNHLLLDELSKTISNNLEGFLQFPEDDQEVTFRRESHNWTMANEVLTK